jgi:hypothetical protein
MGAPYETQNPRLAGIRKCVLACLSNYILFYAFITTSWNGSICFHAATDYGEKLENE